MACALISLTMFKVSVQLSNADISSPFDLQILQIIRICQSIIQLELYNPPFQTVCYSNKKLDGFDNPNGKLTVAKMILDMRIR